MGLHRQVRLSVPPKVLPVEMILSAMRSIPVLPVSYLPVGLLCLPMVVLSFLEVSYVMVVL